MSHLQKPIRNTPICIDECLDGKENTYETIFRLSQDAKRIQKARTREAKKSVEDYGDTSMVKKYPSGACCAAMEEMRDRIND